MLAGGAADDFGTSRCIPGSGGGVQSPGGSSRWPGCVRVGAMSVVGGGGVEAWPRGASRAPWAPLAPSGCDGTSQRVPEDAGGAFHRGGSSGERERVRCGGRSFVVGGGVEMLSRGASLALGAPLASGGGAGTSQRVREEVEGVLHPAASSRRPERVRGGGISIAAGDVAQIRPRGASRSPAATLALPVLRSLRGESSR